MTMANPPEITANIVREMTVPALYNRVQTGMAMMVGENYRLQQFLRERKSKLQSEIAEIDALLLTASKCTDSWYQAIQDEKEAVHLSPQGRDDA
jgi:hypothetical protein